MFKLFGKKETDEEIFDRILTQKIKDFEKLHNGGLGRSEFDDPQCVLGNNINDKNSSIFFNYVSKAIKTILEDLYFDTDKHNYDLFYKLQEKQEKYLMQNFKDNKKFERLTYNI